MMNRDDVLAYLNSKGIRYQLHEHAPVFTVEEMRRTDIPHQDRLVKNLFLHDDKKRSYFLVTMHGDKVVNLKELGEKLGTRKLRFVSEDGLRAMLGLEKGHVTPLGLLNDAERKVVAVFDAALNDGPGDKSAVIGVHPMVNNAMVFLSLGDMEQLLREQGTPVRWLDI
ncbi:MAG TPA: prolyl-tRNA synthetase associated domain-containing protein [Bellilinea sp.]|nr:prolyl-tRNA synthetase associated domain-containing protein [Bellilinea sp.]